jgi:plasmid maintenance system antidote protein VapI
VNRVTLSRVLNGRAAISPEMALRIEAWLGVERGGEARLWLAEQSAYDMWQAEQRFKDAPMHVQPAPSMPVDATAWRQLASKRQSDFSDHVRLAFSIAHAMRLCL